MTNKMVLSAVLQLILAKGVISGIAVLSAGTNCEAGCNIGEIEYLAADQSSDCQGFHSGGNFPLSWEGTTNEGPQCQFTMYSDENCQNAIASIDTTQQSGCTGGGNPQSWKAVCEGDTIFSRSDSIPVDYNTSVILPQAAAPRSIHKRQCDVALGENDLFLGAIAPLPGFISGVQGGNTVRIANLSLSGGAGIPGGTINQDARDITRGIFELSEQVREDEVVIDVDTSTGLAFEVTLLAAPGAIIDTSVSQVGAAAMAAIITATLNSMLDSGNDIALFDINHGDGTLLLHVSVELTTGL